MYTLEYTLKNAYSSHEYTRIHTHTFAPLTCWGVSEIWNLINETHPKNEMQTTSNE